MTEIGKIRKSQVLSINGPGAVIDFRGTYGEPVSVVAKGLEGWEEHGPRNRNAKARHVIRHSRLEEMLDVREFREPPSGFERGPSGRVTLGVPAVRFPTWHVCPKCNLLQGSGKWGQDDGKPGLFCRDCTGQTRQARKRTYVVPVRFVVTCRNGHLSDFPWAQWVSHAEGCDRQQPLKLIGEGAGLRGLKVHCTYCLQERSLDQALNPVTLRKIIPTCYGDRPWLDDEPEPCIEPPVPLQRGASNVYFPSVISALDVPPWGDSFEEWLGPLWDQAKAIADPAYLSTFVAKKVMPARDSHGLSADEITRKLSARWHMLRNSELDLRTEEFLRFTDRSDAADSFDIHRHFALRMQVVPPPFTDLVSHLACAERLREVRALTAFSRLEPFQGEGDEGRLASLSSSDLGWLPAVRVQGEGVFFALDEKALAVWEGRDDVKARMKMANETIARKRMADGLNGDINGPMTARFLLVHTLAHALAMRLSLDCGYSTASIRERLYASSKDLKMCGLLLYTAAPDADGTLGGLSREGHAERFTRTLKAAIADLEWCSSDPLCGQGLLSLSEGAGLAACHACTFTPETSCEHFNRHLDRVLLVGTPECPEMGFFHSVMS